MEWAKNALEFGKIFVESVVLPSTKCWREVGVKSHSQVCQQVYSYLVRYYCRLFKWNLNFCEFQAKQSPFLFLLPITLPSFTLLPSLPWSRFPLATINIALLIPILFIPNSSIFPHDDWAKEHWQRDGHRIGHLPKIILQHRIKSQHSLQQEHLLPPWIIFHPSLRQKGQIHEIHRWPLLPRQENALLGEGSLQWSLGVDGRRRKWLVTQQKNVKTRHDCEGCLQDGSPRRWQPF